MIYYLIIITLAAIDRVLKYLVNANIPQGGSKFMLGGFIDITNLRNTGAAFSSFTGHRAALIAVTVFCIAVGLVYITRHRKNRSSFLLTSLSLVIAGGIGNLIDRIVQGYVTDYISVGSFPVFNFADICVVIGCVFMCIYVLFLDRG
ncbi:MAG: signal peptidase II [Anaerovoracaceae bacterium]|nr:signal peptidase II [Anaerovoracaceae bacterium]